MKRIYKKIVKIMKIHASSEFDHKNNRILLDVENGTVIYYILTGKLILMLSYTKRLLSGQIVSIYPKKTYYRDFETPWCLKPELLELKKQLIN